MSLGVPFFKILDGFQKPLEPSLFEHAHEIRGECLFSCDRDFCNFQASFGKDSTFFVLEDICSVDG